MILEADLKAQLAQYLEMMEGDVLLKVSAGSDDVSRDMVALVDELATMSEHIKVEKAELERTPSFSVDRKSTRLNSSHVAISYAVFCLKKKILNSRRCCYLTQRIVDGVLNM